MDKQARGYYDHVRRQGMVTRAEIAVSDVQNVIPRSREIQR